MKPFIILILLFISFGAVAQTKRSISVIDFVKIKNNNTKEALYFYENNWKEFRDFALKNNFITGYRFLTTTPDSVSNFDFMLITDYADSAQLKLSEQRFQQIIKETRATGPKLLNELKPKDFCQVVFSKVMQIHMEGIVVTTTTVLQE